MTDDLRVALIACKRILARLQTLSDAPTGHIRTDGISTGDQRTWICTGLDDDAICNHVNAARSRRCTACGRQRLVGRALPSKRVRESKVPEGVSWDGSGHAPSRRLSLWAHYQWRIQNAAKEQNATKLLELAVAATRDYEEYTGKRRASHHEHHGEAVRELLRDYTGVRSNEAAVWLHVAEKWVRRQRVLHGRDPDIGEERQRDERTQRVVSMSQAGASQKIIALEVGISQQRVSQILKEA